MGSFLRLATATWVLLLSNDGAAKAETAPGFRYPSDEDIFAAWNRWREANASDNQKAADGALAELLAIRQDLGIGDMETVTASLVRAADRRIQASDSSQAWALASAAVALAPEVPFARWGALRAAWASDPWGVTRWFSAGVAAIDRSWRHPRFGRAQLANTGSAVLFGLLATAIVFVVVLFLRHVRYFSHDLWHLWPRMTAQPLILLLGVALLSSALVFRLGVCAALLGLFVPLTFYISLSERLVGCGLIAAVGLIPLAGTWVAERAALSGTPLEALYEIENGDINAAQYAAELTRKVDEQRSTFAETYALARYEYRRGKLDVARTHFERAASLRSGDARLLTNLGNTLFAKGDLDGAIELFNAATLADATLAAPLFNLARLHYWKGARLNDEHKALELGKGQDALSAAQKLDPKLTLGADGIDERTSPNRLLLSPGLTLDEILSSYDASGASRHLSNQLSSWVLGTGELAYWYLYPFALGVLVLLVNWLRRPAKYSRPCDRCGELLCSRCSPGLPRTRVSCSRCLISLGRSEASSESRSEKEAEIIRHRRNRKIAAYASSTLFAGAGQVMIGAPLRGVVYAFPAAVLLFNVFFPRGLIRVPFSVNEGRLPLLPFLAAFLVLSGLSLIALRRRQRE